MDRRILIIRRWLLLIAMCLIALCWCPASWFLVAPCLVLTPIVWIRNGKVLIHPDGPPWKIAVGDSTDATCECCECTETCIRCLSDEAPCKFQAVVDGVSDGTCTSCELFNGTFELDVYSFIGGGVNACDWAYNDTSPCTGVHHWEFLIYRTGGGAGEPPPNPSLARRSYQLNYDGAPFSGNHFFDKKLAGGTDKTDCVNLVDESLNPIELSGSAVCLVTGATCLITSL